MPASVTCQRPEFKMIIMSIAEIIKELDACLSRLRQARDLLLDRTTEAQQNRVSRRKKKVILRQADHASSSRRRADENKSRSDDPVAHLKRGMKRVDTSGQVANAVAHHAPHSEQSTVAEPER
jgi:hypothetical protein